MKSIADKSSMGIQWNNWYCIISNLQLEHANPGSSESDLVGGKMKKAVIYTMIIQSQ